VVDVEEEVSNRQYNWIVSGYAPDVFATVFRIAVVAIGAGLICFCGFVHNCSFGKIEENEAGAAERAPTVGPEAVNFGETMGVATGQP
jgi:hypothetical protein